MLRVNTTQTAPRHKYKGNTRSTSVVEGPCDGGTSSAASLWGHSMTTEVAQSNSHGFFLCGYLKERVYNDNPQTLVALKKNIRREISSIEPSLLQRVAHNTKVTLAVPVEQVAVGNAMISTEAETTF
ncbi:hypothetical protein EVAR_32007_1 [Eumeta japonica]|uniref:Uncharacterized protein n=1 Tax=Eumeta variegata TaxID=151549 RepID=A0A4C2AD39_EUMVA|nr:hypothetical protein EVAR_32007_1 [Eumeta japonica]